MTFKDTIELMKSSDYQDRFKAEYMQTYIRYKKLQETIIKLKSGTSEFRPKCPISVLEQQKQHMVDYLKCLELRAEIEGVRLV